MEKIIQEEKVKIELHHSEASFLITCLEKYLEKETSGTYMREIAKLIEHIDDQF